MDILAHALWGLIFFDSLDMNLYLIILFSLLPDFSAFSFEFVKLILGFKKFPHSKEEARKKIPRYVGKIYNFTHSLVLVGCLFLILFIFYRSFSWYILPWILHILLDIPSHPRDFFGTPIFYPFSSYKFDGYEWGKKWFMIVNYSLIAIGLVIVYLL